MRSAKVNVGDSGLASQYNNLRSDAYGASLLLPHQQSTPGLTLYIEAGVCYIGGTQVVFAGGNSPAFTAPSANPRIDILTIDSAGTLAITQGAENASPVAPAYPANKIVLCEVYNRVSETALYDTDPGGSTGYISRDVRPIVQLGGYIATSSQIAVGALTGDKFASLGSIPGGAGVIPNANLPAFAAPKFGGTGADGALNVTSGTTSIDIGSATVLIKNYTSINISGGATVNFINPNANGSLVILKSLGNVTIAGTLDVSGMGGAGGASVGHGSTGVAGGSSADILDAVAHSIAGIRGQDSGSDGGNTANPASFTVTGVGRFYTLLGSYSLYRNMIHLAPGVGGGSGGGGGNSSGGTGPGTGGNSGAGGAGGGALYIECGGNLNFTGTINANGSNGSNGGSATNATGTSVTAGGGGAGGGGGGGMILVLYNFLTANSGTVNANGGNGGTGANGGQSSGGPNAGSVGGGGGAGAGGASLLGNGGQGGAGGGGNGVVNNRTGGTGGNGGSANNPGSNGNNATGSNSGGSVYWGGAGGGGGGGAGGAYLITLNTEFS
jgi:hypothetical protein